MPRCKITTRAKLTHLVYERYPTLEEALRTVKVMVTAVVAEED
jgi:hypothetical protein